MADSIPVILDTDIGSDIDDAVALAYLLRQPRCELVGITTVTGDVAQRAACADAICRAAGRENVPIHCGAANVLLTGPGQPEVPQHSAIATMPHQRQWRANTAVDFLRSAIRQRPGEIALLSIGPLTNIAILFAADPEIPSLLGGFVSMAGTFFRGEEHREWNVLVDPIASAIVYATAVRDHLSIGLDVTLKCTMPAADVRKRFVPPPLPTVAAMAEVWFGQREQITFHDPLAAVAIFNPEVCGYERGTVDVPIDPDPKRFGRSIFTPSAHGPHRVAKSVDPAVLFENYFGVFR